MAGLAWSNLTWAGGSPVFPPAPVAFAATYVHPQGRNEAPYDNWEKAAHSIQDAIMAAGAGGKVVVYPGTYQDAIITTAADQSVMAYIGATTSEQSIFPHDKVVIAAGNSVSQYGLHNNHAGSKFYGLTIRDFIGTDRSGIYTLKNNAYFQACRAINNQRPLYFEGVNILCERCEFADSLGAQFGDGAIGSYGTSTSIRFLSCVFNNVSRFSFGNIAGVSLENCNYISAIRQGIRVAATFVGALKVINCTNIATGTYAAGTGSMFIENLTMSPINITNCNMTGYFLQPGTGVYYMGTGGVAESNTTTTAPGFVSPRYPQSSLCVSVDDGLKEHVAYSYALAAIAEQYGYKVAYYVSTRNVYDLDASDWAKLKELVQRGHEVGTHTRHHIHLGDRAGEGINVQCANGTLTIAGNMLTITVGGSAVASVSLADKTMSIATLVAALNGVSGVTATLGSSSGGYNGWGRAWCLADVAALDISSSVNIPLDLGRVCEEEITGSLADIAERINLPGWTPNTLAYPYNSNDLGIAAVLDAYGIIASRGPLTASTASMVHKFDNINLNRIWGPWLVVGSTSWDVSTVEITKANAAAMFSGLVEVGGVVNLFTHNEAEFPLAHAPALFQQAKLARIKGQTMRAFAEYVRNPANGWTDTGNNVFTNGNLAQRPDYRLAADSPLIGAGNPDTTAVLDFNGKPFPAVPPIGAFNAA